MKKYLIEIKWSIILGLLYLGWFLFEKIVGFHSSKALYEPLFNLLFTPIFGFIFYLAIKNKKQIDFSNEINWKQGFGSGIVLAFFVALTTSIATYLTFLFISPDFFKNAIQMSSKQNMEDQYNIGVFIKNNIFGMLSFGVVFAAIFSYFLKNKSL